MIYVIMTYANTTKLVSIFFEIHKIIEVLVSEFDTDEEVLGQQPRE